MQLSILGPLEVTGDDGTPVPVAGVRLRRLLTRLAWQAGVARSGPAGQADLVEAVWLGDAPAEPANALQSLVSRLRRLLGSPGMIRQLPGGYGLGIEPDGLDMTRFLALAADGHRMLNSGLTADALTVLGRADRLWRGSPLADADGAEWAIAAEARLAEQRLAMLEDLFEASILTGRSTEVLDRLEEVAAVELVRERFTGQLMRALALTGRNAEALAAYARLRAHLADELGVDPGADLQSLHLDLLRGDLGAPPPAPAVETARVGGTGQLRSFLTSFLGREDDLLRLTGLLATHRLITVVGPGGAGKTRLATETARAWIQAPGHHDRSACMVELAPVGDESGVEVAFLDSLGRRSGQAPGNNPTDPSARDLRDYRDRILDRLADSQMLVIVDNCEHLLGAVAELLDDILARCPGVRVLATSREPLGMVGEAVCALAPLGLPTPDATPGQAVATPAVRLLLERAAAVNPAFAVDEDTVASAVQIVRRLDGLPLAIELAAARLRVLPVAEIAARLDDRFRLLTGGNRSALPRHRTLRAVVEWSWELLSEPERAVAERLSVFPAGATAAAAVAVSPPELAPEMPGLLLALVDKSLLQVDVGSGSDLRYRMLETIREFGIERLIEQGIVDRVRADHARYFRRLVTRLDPVLRTAAQLTALHTLNVERENLLAGLRYLADRAALPSRAPATDPPRITEGDLAISMVLRLSWYWLLIGASQEATFWQDVVLRATEPARGAPDPTDPQRIFLEAARLMSSMGSGDYTEWDRVDERMLELLGRLEPQWDHLTDPLQRMVLPMLAYFAEDGGRAARLFDRNMDDPDEWVRGATYAMRAGYAENRGESTLVEADVEQALPIFEKLGDRWGLSTVLQMRGNLRTIRGWIPEAITDLERAWRYTREIQSIDDDFVVVLRLADLKARGGDITGAREMVRTIRQAPPGSAFVEERRLMADAADVGLAWQQGAPREEIDALVSHLRTRLDERIAETVRSPLDSHIIALLSAMLAAVAVQSGENPADAIPDIVMAYRRALLTNDHPVIAVTGVSIAMVQHALGDSAAAAEVLGAAAALRGDDDATDLRIAALTAGLRAALGDGFESRYSAGKSLDHPAAIGRLDPAAWLNLIPGAGPETAKSGAPAGNP